MQPRPARTILVVEDERVVAKDLQRSLVRLGYLVPVTAANSHDALRFASDRCPDLVLMDIHIKGDVDGIETARILKTRFEVPVVYLTAHSDEETIARAKTTEPHGYLLKPVKPEELRSTVEVALYKHEMERRLRDRERWFSTTLRSIGDAVISTDATGRVSFMNPVAESLTGWRSEQAQGRPLSEVLRLVDEYSRAAVENPIARALREGRVVNVNANLVRNNGKERPIADSAAPIVDEKGDVVGAVIVFRDVGEQREMQRQLELADRLASLGTIAAGVAHEVNNPLAFILANLSYAMEQLGVHRGELGAAPWADELTTVLAEARDGGQRIARIVDDLRSFSRPRTGRSGRADVKSAMEWALKISSHEISARARLVTDLGKAPAVLGDEMRLGQVFVNLLVNAAQAITSEHPAEHEVRVTVGMEPDGRALVEVRDSGIGMAADVVKRIFDPFFTTKAVGKDTGLGLAVSHGIVTSMGGEIQVHSELGKGTTFRVLLPAALPEQSPPPPGPVAAAQRANILVIDDEPLVCSSLVRLLGDEHTVTALQATRAALDLIAGGARFDVILCDLMVPDMTGIELYEEVLRKWPEQARRMVFMTAAAFTQTAVEFLSSVTNPQIEKPFDSPEAKRLINTLVAEWGLAKNAT